VRRTRLLAVTIVLGAVASLGIGTHRMSATQAGPVTFNNQVVRILQENCQVCHRPGDIGPFSLITYNDAKLFSVIIQSAVEDGEMPPWKPAEGCGEFEGERRLTEEEISTIVRWVEEGTPEGSPADLPPPIEFGDWPLGQPDVVLEPDSEFSIELGDDVFRCFSLPTDLRGDRFLAAIDVKPESREIVHHASLYIDESGDSRALDDADRGPGYDCSGGEHFMNSGAIAWWTPGSRTQFEAAGAAWRIKKGARLVLQIHYHAHHGGGHGDRTQVGLYFARSPVTKELRTLSVSNHDFVIPAGDSNFQVTATGPPIGAGQQGHATAIAPHMHLLGREFEVEAKYADGSSRCLLKIPEWDAHFQEAYSFAEPVPLPVGTRLSVTASYDNSQANPDNPNRPPIPVTSGHRTDQEMCIAYLKYTLDSEVRELSAPEIKGVSIDSNNRLDIKGKGFLEGADIEVNGRRISDTVNLKKKKASKRLRSNDDWRGLIAPGVQVAVTVLNPDGVRSSPTTFSR
jgi:mono/diheme cytochrome c family protein